MIEHSPFEKTDNISNNANNLLPLLLSSMQGGENMDMMKLLSSLNSNSATPQLIQTLTNSLNKNKKKEAPEHRTSSPKPFPKNEFIY